MLRVRPGSDFVATCPSVDNMNRARTDSGDSYTASASAALGAPSGVVGLVAALATRHGLPDRRRPNSALTPPLRPFRAEESSNLGSCTHGRMLLLRFSAVTAQIDLLTTARTGSAVIVATADRISRHPAPAGSAPSCRT